MERPGNLPRRARKSGSISHVAIGGHLAARHAAHLGQHALEHRLHFVLCHGYDLNVPVVCARRKAPARISAVSRKPRMSCGRISRPYFENVSQEPEPDTWSAELASSCAKASVTPGLKSARTAASSSPCRK